MPENIINENRMTRIHQAAPEAAAEVVITVQVVVTAVTEVDLLAQDPSISLTNSIKLNDIITLEAAGILINNATKTIAIIKITNLSRNTLMKWKERALLIIKRVPKTEKIELRMLGTLSINLESGLKTTRLLHI
jgi:hypothetical protein